MSISRTSQKQIRILTCRQDVELLRSFWTACPTHRDADIDFFLFIGDLFPSVLRPHVVVLYDGSEPLAVLVARLEISRVPIKIGYWSLPSPEMRVLQISGWLGQTEKYAQVLAQSLSRSLKEGEADVACFRYIDRNSALAQHARTAVSRPFSDVSKVFHSHWYCDRKDNETFLQGLSRNQRAQQRRRERKIARAFDTHRIELFCSAEQIGKLIQDVEQVARKSYQRRLNVGFSIRLKFVHVSSLMQRRVGWVPTCFILMKGPVRFGLVRFATGRSSAITSRSTQLTVAIHLGCIW